MRRNPWLADFRVHSTFSDGVLNIPELVDLYGSRGFGAIAITDVICKTRSLRSRTARLLNYRLTEANYPLYREILRSEARRAWDEYRMVVITGLEIPNAIGGRLRATSLVGLGIDEFIATDGTAGDIASRIREQGGLVVASQPIINSCLLRELADACEVTDGRGIAFGRVLRSGLPLLASSGLRRPSQLTSWKTALSCERSQNAIFAAIRRRDVSLQFYAEEENDGDSGSIFDRGLVGRGRTRRFGNIPAMATFQMDTVS